MHVSFEPRRDGWSKLWSLWILSGEQRVCLIYWIEPRSIFACIAGAYSVMDQDIDEPRVVVLVYSYSGFVN